MKSTHIMIVDDTPENLHLLSNLLRKADYRVSAFPRGDLALRAALRQPPNLIMLDITMPDMDGYQLCEKLKQEKELKDVPVIFISALDGSLDKTKAFRAGGVDYITKPFQVEEVYARVDTHLTLRAARQKLQEVNSSLQQRVADQLKEINLSQRAMIFALAKLSHMRDDNTGLHLERVQGLCKVLATELLKRGSFADTISGEFIETIYQASPLHDLGKVGISDNILLKPGRLSSTEFEIMKTHTTLGAATLEFVHARYPDNGFVKMGIDIAKYHHERWDGTGYPNGLKGEEIPLSARIMAVVDVYEALRSNRPYKKAKGHDEALQILLNDTGKYFDPEVVTAFYAIEAKFEELYATISETQIEPCDTEDAAPAFSHSLVRE